MGDNLPLLPDKETLCADVRPILREVFRDVHYLPTSKLLGTDDEKLNVENASPAREVEWVNNISSEYKKLHEHEIKLQQEHAKRLARDTPRNQYRLHSPVSSSDQTWKLESALLRRRDLKPSLEQNSNCKESLWVKNILNKSSGNVTVAEKIDIPSISNVPPLPFDEGSLESISMGEIISRPPPLPPVVPLPPAAPNYIVSIPPKFDFMNFKVGELHTQSLRLVNISKFEVRLSIRPPSRRELDIELCSRLVVTSGSAAEIKIHFRPKDVRAFTEQLDIRVSNGQRLCIPIACFMEPPSLEILVNNKGSSSSSFSKSIDTSNDIIDLGTKLLGDNHRAEFLLRCNAKHASFFLLSEDSWIDYTIEFTAHQSGKGKYYGIAVDSFFISPVRWSGGEDVHGLAVCKATEIGLHVAALRVISSTAISRPLHLVADTIMFTPKHITIQAHEKDYDICSEGDPSCEYYVNLGVTFPHRSLTVTINITNHSPLYYNYYWSSRSWGVCCCWNYSEELLDVEKSGSDLCPGAREAKEKLKKGEEIYKSIDKELKQVLIDGTIDGISPHSTMQLTVRLPDSGSELGIQRSVLMLTLKDIPKESITEEHECLIVNTKDIAEEVIPGTSLDSSSRQVCEVLCAQMEVWWEVVPVRFVLDPPVLRLPHSRRIKSVTAQIRATQLYGGTNIRAKLELLGNLPTLLTLTPEQPTITTFMLPLLSDRQSHTDVIRLTSEDNEWFASTSIEQYCETRHPSIKPSFTWLGVVPPGATVTASLTICNDTYEDIEWCATVYRWWGERGLADACKNQPPCITCHSRACTCSILTPTRGTLKQSQRDKLMYKTSAPDSDGCVTTLVRVHRTDTSTIGSSLEARASLLAYRVLSPHLVLRVLPCYGDKRGACEGCSLDAEGGAPLLRPRAALVRGGRACCRLRLANVAPLAASVLWEPAIEGDDILGVTFLPNEFQVEGYSEIDIMVVLEAKRVTDRRLFIRRAQIAHTKKPLYLVIDAAVSGVEVVIEFPTGDKETLSFASFKLMQKDDLEEHNSTVEPRTVEDIFTDYDLKRKKQRG
ncbi:unnamed protein product [Euphydryas editha]|uniref:Uncharacterized protein n=1 Tax=Euphydryas editha TaxID=104508 RepID=A0AAU9UG03_EUPED|nr:unnamed protein product [Euphydryas editha]